MALAQLAPAAPARTAPAAAAPARLAYLDNLRAAMVAMVIVHHAAQAYGPTGGAWPIFNPTRAAILGPFFTVNAAFGLGLLFLIAGACVPRSYDRKGPRRFLLDRLARLGPPLLLISLALMPLVYAADPGQPLGPFLAAYLRRPETGHMWFVSLLLLFACGYAAWRQLARPAPPPPAAAAPGHGAILAFTLALAGASFLVRLWFPIDRWLDPAPLVHIEPAHMPQYLSFFVVGVVAARRGWLARLPARAGLAWLAVGLSAAALVYAATIISLLTPIDLSTSPDDGLHLSALLSCLVEAMIAVGLSVGLLTIFRERMGRQGAVARELAASSYAAYIIHIFPVVAVQLALAPAPLPPLAKFGVAALLSVPLCFLLAVGLRRLPRVLHWRRTAA